MELQILTPEQAAALDEAAAAFKKLSELLNELAENFKENYGDLIEELKECVEIPEKETYEPCLKIGFPKAPKIPVKLWRKNRALFRPYKRGV